MSKKAQTHLRPWPGSLRPAGQNTGLPEGDLKCLIELGLKGKRLYEILCNLMKLIKRQRS